MTSELYMLLIATIVGYMLGALPLADRISRRRGVNIFSSGTGLAGSSNVLKTVGKIPAAIVALGDMAKGILAVLIAQVFGIDGPVLVIPVAAAVIGHWHSVFTRFRGGDALVTFGGSTIAMFTGYGVAAVALASIVTLLAKRLPFDVPFASLFSIISGYIMIVGLSFLDYTEAIASLVFAILAVIVFAHALLGHAARRDGNDDSGDLVKTGTVVK